jgi:hypothetical protein
MLTPTHFTRRARAGGLTSKRSRTLESGGTVRFWEGRRKEWKPRTSHAEEPSLRARSAT